MNNMQDEEARKIISDSQVYKDKMEKYKLELH